jgi:hypothetical protein
VSYNEIKDEFCDPLLSKALAPSAIHATPNPESTHVAQQPYQPLQKSPTQSPVRHINSLVDDDHGDILVHDFWAHGMDCIILMFNSRTRQITMPHQDPDKVLAQHKQEKKCKYLELCLKQQCNFTSFGISTDGLLGK